MPDPIKFIFIATADHASFEDAATARTHELCKKFYDARLDKTGILPAPAILRFIHFNHKSDTIEVFEYSLQVKAKPTPPKKIKWVELNKFVATGDARFSPQTFVDATGGKLNIQHIYHSVRGAPKESVLELSIYSHGWSEGPVIRAEAHSNDNSPPNFPNKPQRRNPADTDGRARTDFEDNMGEDPTVEATEGTFPRTGGKNALEEFKAAFDKNAVFQICGCNGQDPVRDPATNNFTAMLKSTAFQVIRQAYTVPTRANEKEKMKKTKSAAALLGAKLASGAVDPNLQVPLDMEEEFKDERRDIDKAIEEWKKKNQGKDVETALNAHQINTHYSLFNFKDKDADLAKRREHHYGLDASFFPPPTSTDMQLTRSWEKILGFVARRMQLMYGFKAASVLKIKVVAGPVGVKSSLIKSKQMQVCGEKKNKDKKKLSDCERALGFHEKFMGMKRDERNYSIFDQQAVAKINELAKK